MQTRAHQVSQSTRHVRSAAPLCVVSRDEPHSLCRIRDVNRLDLELGRQRVVTVTMKHHEAIRTVTQLVIPTFPIRVAVPVGDNNGSPLKRARGKGRERVGEVVPDVDHVVAGKV